MPLGRVNRDRAQIITEVLDRARNYKGFRSRANRVNGFGAGVRQDGKAWNGSFLETVMFEAGAAGLPSLTSSTAALAYFVRTNRLFDKPQIGDIVFYAFSADDDGLGQPHLGLVTEVRDFKKVSKFRAIEGMTESGQPKGPQEPDGVYERTRYGTDVLGFARPLYTRRVKLPEPAADISVSLPALRPSNFQPGKLSNGTALLQLALHDILGASNFSKGLYDEQTVSAVRAYQRHIGLVQTTGLIDDRTLTALAKETGLRYFRNKGFTPDP